MKWGSTGHRVCPIIINKMDRYKHLNTLISAMMKVVIFLFYGVETTISFLSYGRLNFNKENY